MRTGILGGTFDPIHLGHLILAETAYDAARLDRVILMPTGHSYFKEDQKVTAPEVRLAMCQLAAEGNGHFLVSDLESRRPGDTYTVTTLRELAAQYPEDSFYYIVGADTLVMMSLWKEPQEIFNLATILVAARSDEVKSKGLDEEIDMLEQRYHARIQKLPVRNIEISSTDVRSRIREGRSVRYLVPDKVKTFIDKQQLYR